ncbi:hypothetical protein J6590_105612 [Homalodisca vitripennis]|nr:hypothetical protein J6590_105612 [Homalodisca vitripennis]
MRRLEFHTISLPSPTSLTYGNISPTITDLTDVREHLGNWCNETVRGERMRRLEFHTISLPSLTSLTYGNISPTITDLTDVREHLGNGCNETVRGERMRRLELHTISLPSLTSLMHGDISLMGPTITDLTDVREHLGNGCNETVRGERMRRLELHTISLPSLTSLTYGDISRGEDAEIRFTQLACPPTSLMYRISVMGVMKQAEEMRRLEFHTISLPSLTSLMHEDISVIGVMKESEEIGD